MRGLLLGLIVVVSAIGAHFATPYLSEGGANIIVTVFTVLAGFIVGIIVIVGDPSLLPPGGWKEAEKHRDLIEKRLIRHAWMFGLYLVTIGFVFLSVVVNGKDSKAAEWLKYWSAALSVWLAIMAFLFSLALPKMMMDMQRERVDNEIATRRKNEGLPDEPKATKKSAIGRLFFPP